MKTSLLLIPFLALMSISYGQTLQTNKAALQPDGCLTYAADADQNRIPDFSHAGYKGGGVAIPDIVVVQTISPIAGDNTAHIQAAIDAVGNLPLDANGFRGALLLNPGTYEVSGQLFMNKSGVVLRGSGDGRTTANPTIIFAKGNVPDQRDVIELGGGNTGPWDDQVPNTQQNITTNFVQVGSRTFEVADASPYSVGDNIIVFHPSTQAWIDAVDGGGVVNDAPWSVGQYSIPYNRYITNINGNEITIDAPVYNHLDKSLSQSYIYVFDRQDMRTNIGIENLRIDIESLGGTDENHAWNNIVLHEVEDAWVRNITTTGFGLSGVKTRKASRVTVSNVHSIDPVSLVDGGRRYNFQASNFSNNILFEDCYANNGRHTYSVNGTPSASGIVFLRSVSENPLSTSEPHRQWSNGILYDNLRDFGTLPGNNRVIGLYNRRDGGTAHGWSAVNSVLWNVDVSRPGTDGIMLVEKPPIGQNYAIGTKGTVAVGNASSSLGYVEHNNANGELEIESLYEAQLLCRTNTVLSNFTASIQQAAPGQTITFTENAQGPVTSYAWDFGEGATPATATGAGPHDVTYATVGSKTVSLTVSNGADTHIEIKSPFIEISDNTLFAENDTQTTLQNQPVATQILANDIVPPAQTNLALSFDGNDDKVSIDASVVSGYPFTMSAWYKTTTTADQFIIYKGRSSSNFLGHTIRMIDGIVRMEAVLGSGNANRKDILDNQTTNDGQWHHVAAVFESPTSRLLYVDGILKGSDNETADIFASNTPNRFSVGVRDDSTPNGFYTGEIDEVRVYGSILSITDVNNIMSGRDCSSSTKNLYYNFNAISGSVVEDQFNSFDGSITGTTSTASPLSIGELEATIIAPPTNGTATFTNDFEINYLPNDGFIGTDVLTYQLRFGDCEVSQATITYTVQEPPCSLPTNISLLGLTNNSAEINWTLEPNATNGYEYILVTDGTTPDQNTTPDGLLSETTTSIEFTGLSAGVSYVFYIRSDCDADGLSIWSQGLSFSPNILFATDDSENVLQDQSVTTQILINDIFPTNPVNTALSFDGVDDKVSFGDFSDLPNTDSYPFTLTAWYKTTSTADQFIMYKGRSSSNFTGHTIRMIGGVVRLEAVLGSGNANTIDILDNQTTNDGEWHHVAAVFESTTSRLLYVDGVLKGTDNTTADVFNLDSGPGTGIPSRVSVGVRDDSTPNGFFTGEIDEVRIYESPLSLNEVNDILSGRDCTNNVKSLYYDFNTITSTAVEDRFGDQDATINGAVSVASTLSIGVLEAFIITQPTNGTATFTSDFEITYQPIAGFTGIDQLTYQLRFGECEISQATISYSVNSSTCPVPDNFAISNITETSADISWNAVVEASNGYDFVLFTDNTVPDSTTVPTGSVTTTSVDLTMLNAGTAYTFYVRSNCVSSNGDWSAGFEFATTCSPIMAPYTENFDGINWLPQPDNLIDICWSRSNSDGSPFKWIVNTGNTPTGTSGPSGDVSGSGNYLFTEGTGSSSTSFAFLDAPVIDLSNLISPTLKFSYHMYGDNMGALSVEVKQVGAPTFNQVFIAQGQQQTTNSQRYLEALIDLSSYAGQQVQIRFVADRDGFRSDMAIDEFAVINNPCNSSISGNQDTDGDGVADACDLDSDNDGILDADEKLVQNVALQGTAIQSTTLSGADASLAIDGNIDGDFGNGSVTLTDNSSPTEYWEIDLGRPIDITDIIFYNRTDCCSGRMNNVFLFVADTPFPANKSDLAGSQTNADYTYQFDSGVAEAVINITVNTVGRYVRLQKSGNNSNNSLSIAELQIFTENRYTDSDNIPDHLDLDSDNDGCSDANEYYELSNADGNIDGTDDDRYGNSALLTVDSDGLVTLPGATYNGSAQGLSNVRDTNIADACTALGLDNNPFGLDLKLYPNPTRDGLFTINAQALKGLDVNIEIFNVLGKKLLNKTLNVDYTGALNVNASALTSGMYFVKLKHDNQEFVQKLIIE